MSDFEQWRQKGTVRASSGDTGNSGLFWLLVVVAAMGALVFVGSLSGGPSAPAGADGASSIVVPDDAGAGGAGGAVETNPVPQGTVAE